MRLIDADILRDLVLNYDNNVLDNDQINAMLDLIDDMPDVNAIELPCRVGDEVYVSHNNATFYRANLYGKNEIGRYIVLVTHKVTDINDLNKDIKINAFYDWFITVYTRREAAEKALAGQYKCKHLDKDGICMLHSNEDYAEPCLMGPCGDEERERDV